MASRAQPEQHGRVARLLILFTMPAPLSKEQADAWLHEAVAGLSAHADVERAELSRLGSGSRRHPRKWERMLELELADGADADRWADTGLCCDWLAELRSLRLQPVVLLAETETVVRHEERA